MKPGSRSVAAVLLTGIWINASEFFRNEVLLKDVWVAHYQSLNMVFPDAPVNGMMWLLWGFLFSFVIFVLSQKYNLVQTALVSWLMGFVLMWISLWNLDVLPGGILLYAVPLSLLEVFVGSYICQRMSTAKHRDHT